MQVKNHLCDTVFDEICGRAMNFVRSCLHHESSIVSSVALYSILHGRYLGVTYHSVCAVITAHLMICCHATLFLTLLVVMFLPVIRVISALLPVCYLNAFWYESREGALKLPVCFLHSDIRDFIVYLSTP